MITEQHPFWDRWSAFLARRPWHVIAVCLVVTLALGYVAWNTPADLSFTGMMRKDHPEVIAYREMIDTFGANAMLLLLIQGEPDEVQRAEDVFASELPKRAEMKRVVPVAETEWLQDRAPWLWPERLFDASLSAVRGETPPEAVAASVKAADEVIRKLVQPDARAGLLYIEFDRDPLDMAMGGQDFYRVSEAAAAIEKEFALKVETGFTGMAALAAEDQANVFQRIRIVTPITLIGVLILLFGVEPRLSRVLMAGFALGASVVIAFGMVGIVQGQLLITVTFFGMLLLGLGIDFGIHLLVSLRDARAHGLSPEESLTSALRHSGTAIVLGGMSTALAFGVITFVPEPGSRSMGFAALFGLTSCMAFMLSFLPAAWLILERRYAHLEAPARLTVPALPWLVTKSLRYPRTVVLFSVFAVVLALFGLPRYALESNLEDVITRDIPALRVEKRLREIYGSSPTVYVAQVESLEQARAWSEELLKLPDIATASSAADILRTDTPQRLQAAQAALDATPQTDNETAAALRARLERAVALGAPSIDNLPPGLTSGTVGKNGELAVRVMSKRYLLDGFELRDQIARVRQVAPTATGMPVIGELAITGSNDYIPILLPAIFSVITLSLIVAFRNTKDVLLALLPVITAASLAFGVYFLAGLQFSILTATVVPVILGLGIDDGIHVVDRLRRYRAYTDEKIHEAVEGVGRPIFLTTATTCVSFAGLLLTDHAGLESIAHFMLLGIPLCFLASVTVLPAAARLLTKSNPND